MSRSAGPLSRRRRVALAVAGSMLAHLGVALILSRGRAPTRERAANLPIEVTVVAAPEPVPEPVPEAPAVAAPEPPAVPKLVRRRRAAARGASPAPEPRTEATAEVTAPPPAPGQGTHPLMSMRAGDARRLIPGDDTLARALGPVEAPPADKPARSGPRRPRMPATGLTLLEMEQDDNVKAGRTHPRFMDVLRNAEPLFNPERDRVAAEVRGDLSAQKSIKRWLLGSFAGDPEALRNQVPRLACLVCVTLRPSEAPVIEIAGASGVGWFDRAASDSIERAAKVRSQEEEFAPARACYYFAAKVWRTRPDLGNLFSVIGAFKLQLESSVKIVSYELIKG